MHRTKEEKRSAQQRELSVGMKRLLTGYRTLLEGALEGEDITLAQLRMLNALNDRAETSAAELARTCYITPQSMQAIVTKAERAGWITRSASSSNRRVLSATLTVAGQQVLRRGLSLARDIEQQIWGTSSAKELRAFNATLSKVLLSLQQHLDARHAEQQVSRGKTA
ncbi:MAG: MarR family winged helix-turn-helix transcriptional regulator [Janthinobacterium lividum]